LGPLKERLAPLIEGYPDAAKFKVGDKRVYNAEAEIQGESDS
jgi:hypothetical protein